MPSSDSIATRRWPIGVDYVPDNIFGMPDEFKELQDAPVPFSVCPRCGNAPFHPDDRGIVQRNKRSLWGLGRRRPYCAVICRGHSAVTSTGMSLSFGCGEIVGWEQPNTEEWFEWDWALFRRRWWWWSYTALMPAFWSFSASLSAKKGDMEWWLWGMISSLIGFVPFACFVEIRDAMTKRRLIPYAIVREETHVVQDD